MSRFSRILIANRGEIACRIIRTAQALGYHTIAVYTDVEPSAPHVAAADAAVCIGAGPVAQSYLAIDTILSAARDSRAGAIHPGYGFLSENAEFARACADAGLVFIGPPPDAIEIMGNKAEAKRRMRDAKVPCVPGYEGPAQDDAALIAAAENIGLPVLIKAAAGGGGRGMRLVTRRQDLADAIGQARSEADNAFGSGELIIEKAIKRPRHVEVQVFADMHGNVINLGERDCSVQRRHQKVIEEAPCPVMTDALRANMSAAAMTVARTIQYCGAGTVEFLLDETGAFYFLEMNTRLQVEHPVTELITGLDLVELQIRVAQGEPLGLSQRDIRLDGHAIEVRLYAEDTAQDFLPSPGAVDLWIPATGAGVRIDSGIESGQDISPFYDPLVAKIIAHGPDREVARRLLLGALKDSVLFGVKNNKQFLLACLEKPSFISGHATTAFISEEFAGDALADTAPGSEEIAVAAVLDVVRAHQRAANAAVIVAPELKNWTSADPLVSHRRYRFGEQDYDLEIRPLLTSSVDERYRVACGETVTEIEVRQIDGHLAHIGIDGKQHVVRFQSLGVGRLHLMIDGRCAFFEDRTTQRAHVVDVADSGRITAPMHGLLLEMHVSEGEAVTSGQPLLVIEAMKMQQTVVCPADGKVHAVHARQGQQVSADALLLEIRPVGA